MCFLLALNIMKTAALQRGCESTYINFNFKLLFAAMTHVCGPCCSKTETVVVNGVTDFGVTVSVISLELTFLCLQRRTGENYIKGVKWSLNVFLEQLFLIFLKYNRNINYFFYIFLKISLKNKFVSLLIKIAATNRKLNWNYLVNIKTFSS